MKTRTARILPHPTVERRARGLIILKGMWWEQALAVDGWMPPGELAFLYAIGLNQPLDARVVEVGSWKGRSTIALCAGLVDRGRLTAVDTFRGDPETGPAVDVENAFRANTAAYAEMLDVIVSESVRAAERFDDGSLHCVFIDGAHDYQSVLADIRAWAPKLRPGGLMCGHDYGKYELTLAVHRSFGRVCHWQSIWFTYGPPQLHLRHELSARARELLGRI